MEKGPEIAALKGEECALENGFASLPIDPFAIAKACEIEVVEKAAKPGVSGMLMRVGEAYAIAYSSYVAIEGFQRFSVSHELGHYFLPGHIDHVLADTDVHESRAGRFAAAALHEREADLFAVGMLMPRSLFRRAIAGVGGGLSAIESLARICKTSLTATAIRFTELTKDAVAVVVTNQEEIEFTAMSNSFQDLNFTWLKRGDPIPRRTLTSRFNGDPSRILDADRDESETELITWFTTHGRNVDLHEEVIGLGRYEKTLTVLSLRDVLDDEEVEEEESLVRSWTPSFGKRR